MANVQRQLADASDYGNPKAKTNLHSVAGLCFQLKNDYKEY